MLVFEEHFQDNRHQWHIAETDRADISIEPDSRYVLDHKHSSGYWVTGKTPESGMFYNKKEFHIHTAIEKLSGEAKSSAGLVWRLLDPQNLLEFTISDEGCFQVAEYSKGLLKVHLPWQPSAAIRTPDGLNILELRRNDAEVAFYINSVCVARLPSDTVLQMSGSNVGFIVHNRIKVKAHHLLISASNSRDRSAPTSPLDIRAACVEHEPPAEDTLEKVMGDIQALIGHRDTKRELFSLASFLKVQTERKKREIVTANTTLHLVLSGPPGTGKTTIARFVGRLYKQLGLLQRGHVIETDRAGIVGGWLGQTAIRVDDAVKQAMDGVLFVDEAYALAPRNGFSHDYGQEALQVLIKRMEDHREQLAVIVAGYTDEMRYFLQVNPGLQSRFTRMFQIDHYTPGELLLIFRKFCGDNGYNVDEAALTRLEETFRSACANRNRRFGNGRFARTLFECCIENQAIRIADSLETLEDDALIRIEAADVPSDLASDLTNRGRSQSSSQVI